MPDERPDEQVLADPDGWGVLVERHWSTAWKLARQFGLDDAAAQDVAQDAFVKLLERAEQFDPSRAFRPWFCQIVRNLSLNALRGQRRRSAREARQARDVRVEAPVVDDRVEQVQAALEALPTEQREVLALHYLGGLTLAQVAQVTETPKGTVDSRLGRGLRKLRTRLEAQDAAAFGGAGTLEALLRQGPAGAQPAPLGALERLRRPARRAAGGVGFLAVVAVTVALGLGFAALLLADASSPRPPQLGGVPSGVGSQSSSSRAPGQEPAPGPAAASPDPRARALAPPSPGSASPAPSAASPAASRDPAEPSATHPGPRLVWRDHDAYPDRLLRVRLLDTAGRPVAGAWVRLQEESHNAFGSRSMSLPKTAYTPVAGGDGVVVFAGVAPGDYTLAATQEGYAIRRGSFTLPVRAQTHTVDLVLDREVDLEATVIGPRGERLAGAQVTPRGSYAREADAEGRVVIEGVLADQPLELEIVSEGGHDQLTVVPRGAPLVLRLRPAVQVTLPFVLPAAGVEQDTGRVLIWSGSTRVVDATIALGRRAVTALTATLQPGRYSVHVTDGGFGQGVSFLSTEFEVPAVAEHTLAPMALHPHQVVDMTGKRDPDSPPLRLTGLARLTVHAPAWGSLIRDHDPAVLVHEGGGWRLVQSSAGQGRWRYRVQQLAEIDRDTLNAHEREHLTALMRSLEALDPFADRQSSDVIVYDLPASGGQAYLLVSGYAPCALGHLNPGDAREVTLPQGGSLELRLVDGDGRPQPGVRVKLAHGPEVSGGSRARRTDPNGLIRFRHVTPGPAELSVERDGGWASLGTIDVEDGTHQRLDRTLP